MREYAFSLTRILPYRDRICNYTGEYGSVKTHILAYSLQYPLYLCKALKDGNLFKKIYH